MPILAEASLMARAWPSLGLAGKRRNACPFRENHSRHGCGMDEQTPWRRRPCPGQGHKFLFTLRT
ncbi:MAG TPA: hypothetical protein PKD55_02645 [Bellilinea sp.]|nr:hypothetical protein [Bellilinea sp.]